jgi:hypothetical protein
MCCKYGIPADYTTTKSFTVKTKSNQPIPNIKLQLYKNEIESDIHTTDSQGFSKFDLIYSYKDYYKIKISDTDDSENLGNFKDTTFEISEYIDQYQIQLSPLKK